MKHTILCILLVFAISITNGQNYKLKNPIPTDTSWKTGILNNGIHYYIKYNKASEKHADFHILYNVGTIQETENQSGLAHFTEHLAFASNKDCPKGELENYFHDIGLERGPDLNAFTSLTNTTYALRTVPMTRKGILDTTMMFIKLFATCMALDSVQIEKERKIILEEWRRSDNANQRISQKLNLYALKGSKYANSMPIGDTAVLKHFRHQELKDYYYKWYRPDHMSVIAVGDFDVNSMASKIKETLGKIAVVHEPSPRVSYPIPDNKKPIIAIATDPEAQSTTIQLYYKHDPDNEFNLKWKRNQIMDELIRRMRQKRILEKTLSTNSVLTGKSLSFLGAPEKSVYFICAGANNNRAFDCFKSLLVENELAYRFGFTITEVEKAKASLLKTEISKRMAIDATTNLDYYQDCSNHIIYGVPLTNDYFGFEFLKNTLPLITEEELNKHFKNYITNRNLVVTISGPQNKSLRLPSEKEIEEAINEVKTISLNPYVDLSEDKQLFDQAIIPGKVIDSKSDSIYGTTEWVLSNGLRVILKPTDFKSNEICIMGIRPGGMSTVNDTDIFIGRYFSKLAQTMGIGNMSKVELGEYLSGSISHIYPTLYDVYDGIGGKCSTKEFETSLQLINLYLTKPNWDEDSYNKFVFDEKNDFYNRTTDSHAAFSDTVNYIRGNRSYRARPFNPDELSFSKFKKVYKEHFTNPSQFTFLMAGTINIIEAKQLIEKYLGCLKGDNGSQKPKRITDSHKGHTIADFNYDLKTPRTSVLVEYSGEMQSYTLKDYIFISLITNILQEECRKTLRYNQQGVYSVEVNKYLPEDEHIFNMYINFSSDPSQADKLKELAKEEVEKFLKNGPADQSLNQAKENILNNYKTLLKDNFYWENQILLRRYFNNMNFLSGYETILKNASVENLKLYLKNILSNKNLMEVVMRPKN